jgi:hypothetical protein
MSANFTLPKYLLLNAIQSCSATMESSRSPWWRDGLLDAHVQHIRKLPKYFFRAVQAKIRENDQETLEGSLSAVSTLLIARVGAFLSSFRDLQDLLSFAPL